MTSTHTKAIAGELQLPEKGVHAVLGMLEEGNTVPFIARYRKEATGGLDEVQIRDIGERHAYRTELEDRRAAILASIKEQGKLTDKLEAKIRAAATKTALEDLYLPYKKKRRTRATIARERGLEPLAHHILAQRDGVDPTAIAAPFIAGHDEVQDVDGALAGARDIIAEIVAENADIRALLRQVTKKQGALTSSVVKKKARTEEAATFRDYFDYDEPISEMPSHRYLAMRRGESLGVLRLKVAISVDRLVRATLKAFGYNFRSPFGKELVAAVEDSFKRLLRPSVDNEVLGHYKERADHKAIDIFAENLRNLLLSPPAGAQTVLAIDPGLRTGSKCVAVAHTGQYLEHRTLFLVRGEHEKFKARQDLLEMVATHEPFAVVVGNGTGGRETEAFVKKSLSIAGVLNVVVASVNEAGASIYSASDIAREEFPDLDLTIRGAVSIGRRFQDPLAELVKLDPKVIGVGQYQHDVDQGKLVRKLGEVVESAVNHVGVELNTASAPLLSYISGIGPKLAGRIVEHRESKGRFETRKQLLDVQGLGPRTFEQAAGFIRIQGGANPLDASAVHPERYPLVERMARDLGVGLKDLIGDAELVGKIDLDAYVDDSVGLLTLRDIADALQKAGRDPRSSFEAPRFREDVNSLEDLKEGMQLEGVVTNVTAFGAFVDIGVHQDGLVHISRLADRFIRDPHEVVKVGDRIRVIVVEVDLARQRVGLSARQ